MSDPVVVITKDESGYVMIPYKHSRTKESYRSTFSRGVEGMVNGKAWRATKEANGHFFIDGYMISKDEIKAIRKAIRKSK